MPTWHGALRNRTRTPIRAAGCLWAPGRKAAATRQGEQLKLLQSVSCHLTGPFVLVQKMCEVSELCELSSMIEVAQQRINLVILPGWGWVFLAAEAGPASRLSFRRPS
jgi:hypothetical protein